MSGTITNPTTFNNAIISQRIIPGDVIIMREGIYSGDWFVDIGGSDLASVTIKPYANEKVIIDGSITLRFPYVTVENIEIRNTRWTNRNTGGAEPEQRANVYSTSSNIRLINCILHDGREVIEAFDGGIMELYGCVLYNGGVPIWGGHSMYTHNNHPDRSVLIENCIFLSSENYGFHAHSSGANHIRNYTLKNNIFCKCNGKHTFGNDTGLDLAVENCVFEDNENLNTYWWMNRWSNLGKSIYIRNNWFDGTNATETGCVKIKAFETMEFVGNTCVYTDHPLVYIKYPATPYTYTVDNNSYYAPEGNNFVWYNDVSELRTDFAGWKSGTGFDVHSSYTSNLPSNRVRVIPNKYDATRCHVAIYNYEMLNDVVVDVSGVYLDGDVVRVHNAQDYTIDYVDSVVANGELSINMVGHTVAIPFGLDTPFDGTMFPKYGAFVLEKT